MNVYAPVVLLINKLKVVGALGLKVGCKRLCVCVCVVDVGGRNEQS